MKRKIIAINQEKCNGCGLCANACHEGAIQMIEGKAKLIRDDFCDGFGDCLPACPAGAITILEREALPYDKTKILKAKKQKEESNPLKGNSANFSSSAPTMWPIQIKLVSPTALFLKNARMLIAADCTAYAYANFYFDFMKDHVTLIGCPKLDSVDYSEKLTAILSNNEIKSIRLVRMEVPCCKGLELAVKKAMLNTNKVIPWQIIVISKDGQIVEG